MGLTPEVMDEMFAYYEARLEATWGIKARIRGVIVDGPPERDADDDYPHPLQVYVDWDTP